MTEAKHTPGPWKATNKQGRFLSDKTKWVAEYDGEVECFSSAPVLAGKTTVALVVSVGWGDAELEANAHLIAAAPALLEALETALGDVLYLAKERGELDRFRGTIDQASAAIAKALAA